MHILTCMLNQKGAISHARGAHAAAGWLQQLLCCACASFTGSGRGVIQKMVRWVFYSNRDPTGQPMFATTTIHSCLAMTAQNSNAQATSTTAAWPSGREQAFQSSIRTNHKGHGSPWSAGECDTEQNTTAWLRSTAAQHAACAVAV